MIDPGQFACRSVVPHRLSGRVSGSFLFWAFLIGALMLFGRSLWLGKSGGEAPAPGAGASLRSDGAPSILEGARGPASSLGGGESSIERAGLDFVVSPLELRFRDARTGLVLTTDGSLLAFRAGKSPLELEVEGGVCALPVNQTEIAEGEVICLMQISIDGKPYTYLELDGTRGDLVAASPLDLYEGEAVPYRAIGADGTELTTAMQVHPFQASGLGVSGPYPDLYGEVRNPFAVPYRVQGGLVEIETSEAWGRLEVGEPQSAGVSADPFAPNGLHLQRTFNASFRLLADVPIHGVGLEFSPVVEGEVDFTALRGSLNWDLRREAWSRAASGWVSEVSFQGTVEGQYRAGVQGAGPNSGIRVEPGEFPVSLASGGPIQLRVETPPPNPVVSAALRIWFDEPLAGLINETNDGLYCGLYSLDEGQVAAGQPLYCMQKLSTGQRMEGDEYSILLRPLGSRGLASGKYRVFIAPVGHSVEIEIEPGASIVDIVVPPLARVRLVPEPQLDPATVEFPSPFRPELPLLNGMPGPLSLVSDSPRQHNYLLAYGKYSLRFFSGVRPRPADFFADEPEMEISFGVEQSYERAIVWQRSGEEVMLKLMSMTGLRVLKSGEPVTGGVIRGRGFSLQHQRVDALVVSVPRPGTYDVHYSINLPGGKKMDRVLPGFEILDVQSIDYVDVLDSE